jgi:hypothetical protein
MNRTATFIYKYNPAIDAQFCGTLSELLPSVLLLSDLEFVLLVLIAVSAASLLCWSPSPYYIGALIWYSRNTFYNQNCTSRGSISELLAV